MKVKTIKCASLMRLLKQFFTADDIDLIYDLLSNTSISWGAEEQTTLIEPKTLFEVLDIYAGSFTESTEEYTAVCEKSAQIQKLLHGEHLMIMIEDR